MEGTTNLHRRETRKNMKHGSQEREYMYQVKLFKTSYANCVWIGYETAQELEKEMHNKFILKIKSVESKKGKLPLIPPRYLQVDKVLGVEIFEEQVKKYYVKWK